jgi:serine/threonine-protein kinase RsbW
MVIPSKLEAAREVEEALLHRAVSMGFSDSAVFGIKLALEEAINNAIKHGNGFDASKTVEVSFEVDPRQAVVVVTDQGRGFDPSCIPDPTSDENLEKPCGRGIMLMKAYMDEVHYSDKGNQVRLVKRNC